MEFAPFVQHSAKPPKVHAQGNVNPGVYCGPCYQMFHGSGDVRSQAEGSVHVSQATRPQNDRASSAPVKVDPTIVAAAGPSASERTIARRAAQAKREVENMERSNLEITWVIANSLKRKEELEQENMFMKWFAMAPWETSEDEREKAE